MLPSSLPFDIFPTIPMLPASVEPIPMQGEATESVEAQFGSALTELLGEVTGESGATAEAEAAIPAVPSTEPRPKRRTAMILPVADNVLPQATQRVVQEALAVVQDEMPVELAPAVDEGLVEELEEETDDDTEAPVVPVQSLVLPVEEPVIVKPKGNADTSLEIAEPQRTVESAVENAAPTRVGPQQSPQPSPQIASAATIRSQEETAVAEKPLRAVVRRAERKHEVAQVQGKSSETALQGGESVGAAEAAANEFVGQAAAKADEPNDGRATLRFRESFAPRQDHVELSGEVRESAAQEVSAKLRESERTVDPSAVEAEVADAASSEPMGELTAAAQAPPPASTQPTQRIEARSADITPRNEALATEKSAAPPSEQRQTPRVSASAAATILDKQASGAVKTVSIRLPIEDGSRAGAAVQIDLARKNSVLEVRLSGTSDGLQRAVTESIDSLVQKLAVDRWSLDAPATPEAFAEGAPLPKLESILPESSESITRPTLRMPSQEIASAARELSLEAPAQSSSSQQSSDGQRNQDFQQDSGTRDNPQQQQEEQKRPRREVWNQFLEAAEESFVSGFGETAPELQ